ncbi:MAG: phage tail assembly protein [Lachnospiraceae bacterium]|nr:phage tail assembly protein [Lachnospiraceae bacterium]
MAWQLEYEFTLPRGYVDIQGTVHREGVMRLATAGDEILPLKDPRVQQNSGYLSVILLARVITRLGSLPAVDTNVIEGLFTMDLAYLQDFYEKINSMDAPKYSGVCPHCGSAVEIPVNFTGAGS